MAITDEELDDKRQHAEKLREQVANEEAKRLTREAEGANALASAQLDAEIVRLEAQLATAKERNKVAAVKDGMAVPLEAVQTDLDNAKAHAKAEDDRRAEQQRLAQEAKEADAKAREEAAAADPSRKAPASAGADATDAADTTKEK
jgi:hypothetical protein